MAKPLKFYRVHYSTERGNSAGYSWHTSLKEAVRAARADYDDDPSEYDSQFNPDERIRVITVVPTKAGILKALSHFAGHPDNG